MNTETQSHTLPWCHIWLRVLVSFQVEAAYDMLLMQSLLQRRAGKVADNSIRYADVKPVKSAGAGTVPLPQWMQTTMKNAPITFETPSSSSLGIQSCVYGALMVFTYASGSPTSLPSAYTSPDVPGFILATGFGASLYFLAKKNMNLGKLIHHFYSVVILSYALCWYIWTSVLRIYAAKFFKPAQYVLRKHRNVLLELNLQWFHNSYLQQHFHHIVHLFCKKTVMLMLVQYYSTAWVA